MPTEAAPRDAGRRSTPSLPAPDAAFLAEETLADQARFDAALLRLIARDPRLGALVPDGIPPALRRRPAGFDGLARMVIAQQVSTASATAIHARFAAMLGGAPTPAGVLAAGEGGLRAAGLSAPKIRALLGIARLLEGGEVDLDALARMPSDAAHAALVKLPGIGPWTADVYLLFSLGRSDAFPAGDLALQSAAGEALCGGGRCDPATLTALAETWRPWRGVAAHVLWAFYGAARTRQGMPA